MMDARQRMRTMKQATELTGSGAINVGGTMKLSMPIGNKREREQVFQPTKEYWQAKADLCKETALKQLEEADSREAMKNLERMVYALSRVKGFTND
jgi:hypothetical protein